MYLFLIIVFIILLAIAVLFISLHFYNKNKNSKYDYFLIENSKALKDLSILNSKYKFKTSKNYNEEHIYDNIDFYNNISCEDYLIYQLQFEKFDIEKEIKQISENKINYDLYCKEISKIYNLGVYTSSSKNLNINDLIYRERTLFNNKKLKPPKTDFSILVVLHCAKMNGEIYETKQQLFSSKEILSLIKRLNNKSGFFYNDKEIWESICRVERGKVSNKLRFDVYERDGYKCRICGKSESDNDLEIDHIKPIAKGGKSELSNLQTLCRNCNKIKSDKY